VTTSTTGMQVCAVPAARWVHSQGSTSWRVPRSSDARPGKTYDSPQFAGYAKDTPVSRVTRVPGRTNRRPPGRRYAGIRLHPPTPVISHREKVNPTVGHRGPIAATVVTRSRVPVFSPGLLVGNPPPRWGAPGDDRADPAARGSANADHAANVSEVHRTSGAEPYVDPHHQPPGAPCTSRHRPRVDAESDTNTLPGPPACRTDPDHHSVPRRPENGVGEPRRTDPAPHRGGLRELRPRGIDAGPGVGQDRRRRGLADVLLGAPRPHASPAAGTKRHAPRSTSSSVRERRTSSSSPATPRTR
jgi:hypothetical protein